MNLRLTLLKLLFGEFEANRLPPPPPAPRPITPGFVVSPASPPAKCCSSKCLILLLLLLTGCGPVTLWDSHDKHVDKRKERPVPAEREKRERRERKPHKSAEESTTEQVAAILIQGGSLLDAQRFWAVCWRLNSLVKSGDIKTVLDAATAGDKIAKAIGWEPGKYPELSKLVATESSATDAVASVYEDCLTGAEIAIQEMAE